MDLTLPNGLAVAVRVLGAVCGLANKYEETETYSSCFQIICLSSRIMFLSDIE
jgi:hypothetical protein